MAKMNVGAINANVWMLVWGRYEEDDWAKVKLKPGQSLSWSKAGATEEGHRAEGWTLRFDGVFVWLDSWSRERDCDGPHEDYSTVRCPIHRLESQLLCDSEWVDGKGYVTIPHKKFPGKYVPDWEKFSAWQRDHYAEMTGY